MRLKSDHKTSPLAGRCRIAYGSVTASVKPEQIIEVVK
jgi:hypothetical protein